MSPDTRTTSTTFVQRLSRNRRVQRFFGGLAGTALAIGLGSAGAAPAAARPDPGVKPTIAVKSYSDRSVKVYPKAKCTGTAKTIGPGGSTKGLSYRTTWGGVEYSSNDKVRRKIGKGCHGTDRNVSVDVIAPKVI